jgi:hypothetical protein
MPELLGQGQGHSISALFWLLTIFRGVEGQAWLMFEDHCNAGLLRGRCREHILRHDIEPSQVWGRCVLH